jgi:hypothetical protein
MISKSSLPFEAAIKLVILKSVPARTRRGIGEDGGSEMWTISNEPGLLRGMVQKSPGQIIVFSDTILRGEITFIGCAGVLPEV